MESTVGEGLKTERLLGNKVLWGFGICPVDQYKGEGERAEDAGVETG